MKKKPRTSSYKKSPQVAFDPSPAHGHSVAASLPSAVTFSSWILLDAGLSRREEQQCVALLESLKMRPQIFYLHVHPLARLIPRALCPLFAWRTQKKKALISPWPDFVLAQGSVACLAARQIKKRSSRKTFAVSLHNPKTSFEGFDVVISTADDPVTGPNVISTTGGFSTLSPQKLRDAAPFMWGKINSLPQPWIGVVIKTLDVQNYVRQDALERLIRQLTKLSQQTGGGLMIYCVTPLPAPFIYHLESALAARPHIFFKGDGNDDAYEGLLGVADYLLAPADSTHILVDMIGTDKPLYLYPSLSNAQKYQSFVTHLSEKGLARVFEGKLDFWSRPFFSEREAVAQLLLKRLMEREDA